MEGNWDVYEGQQKVGRCSVKKEGLYYEIHCQCRMKPGIYRLFWGEERVGILVPEEGKLVLETRQAMRKFPQGKPELTIRQRQKEGRFVPLSPAEPFAYLQQLEKAHFARKEGQAGILLPEQG